MSRKNLFGVIFLMLLNSNGYGQELAGIVPGGTTSLFGFYKDVENSSSNQNICTFSAGGNLVAGTHTYDPVGQNYYIVISPEKILTIHVEGDGNCSISASGIYTDLIRSINWDRERQQLMAIQTVASNGATRLVALNPNGNGAIVFATIPAGVTGNQNVGVHAYDDKTGTYYIASGDQVFFLKRNGSIGSGPFNPFGSLRSLEFDTKINRLLGVYSNNGVAGLVIANGTNFSEVSTHPISGGLRAGVNAYYDETGLYTVATGTQLITFNRHGSSHNIPIPGNLISIEYVHQDSDKDALPDAWEINGIEGVDLPAMGAEPFRKDIFIEVDEVRTIFAGITKSTVELMVEAFERKNIALHVDAGPSFPMNVTDSGVVQKWGRFSRSNSLPDTGALMTDCADRNNPARENNFTKPLAIRRANMSAFRVRAFHYVIWGVTVCPNVLIPGISAIVTEGEPLIVIGMPNLPFVRNKWNKAANFMHELGHNLSLFHGGPRPIAPIDQRNLSFKTNSFSVMNYLYSIFGLFRNGGPYIDYASFTFAPFNESAVLEINGLTPGTINGPLSEYGARSLCQNPDSGEFEIELVANNLTSGNGNAAPIDWNCNDVTDTSSYVLNFDRNPTISVSYEEWNHLDFKVGSIGWPILDMNNSQSQIENLGVDVIDEITYEEILRFRLDRWVSITTAVDHEENPGVVGVFDVQIHNDGEVDATYSLGYTNENGWLSFDGLPSQVFIEAGKSVTLFVSFEIPASAADGFEALYTIEAVDLNNIQILDTFDGRVSMNEALLVTGFE